MSEQTEGREPLSCPCAGPIRGSVGHGGGSALDKVPMSGVSSYWSDDPAEEARMCEYQKHRSVHNTPIEAAVRVRRRPRT